MLVHFVGNGEDTVIHEELMMEHPPEIGWFVKFYGEVKEVQNVMLILQHEQNPFYRVMLGDTVD
jgi:hypothetical protein